MKVLLIGSGGREHAIAWKVAQSAQLSKLYIAPGNAGTATCGENVPLEADDHFAILGFCEEKGIELVIIGPESPLAAGLADDLRSAGIRVFGPGKLAAQIEASKVFSKQFMSRYSIPTARYAVFQEYTEACRHLEAVDYPVVIKASGLAAGKGVILPDSRVQARQALEAIMVSREFGEAGREIVIEERLIGQEVSLMVFTDGTAVKTMPAAQDHKRLLDGDLGPNTGGMGAYSPAPVFTPELLAEAMDAVIHPAVAGLRCEGTPFVGVLYAGLMLCQQGVRVLEFNCRFGDPETQAVLPLLDSDFLEVVNACVDGGLEGISVRWRGDSAACVVLASEGYPGKPALGRVVRGLDDLPEDTVCFHAGTKLEHGKVVTSGGRVFGVTSRAATLAGAVQQAYRSVERIAFDGMQYRHDIAGRALKPQAAYTASGVSIDVGNRAVELMKDAVRSTYTPAVLAGIGSFGGLFDATVLKDMQAPVLVASTDGVGTKVKLAAAAGRCRSIGHDIVNHCINDILVQGARPLFFLDYFATSVLCPDLTTEVVTGIAEACRESGMALIGGETAEMPGVYQPGEFDLAGTIIGTVERDRILPHPDLRAGDLIIGLASSGAHTNGYSLIRRVFTGIPPETVFPELGIPLVEALLAPHRSYYPILYPHLSKVKALAHITGGGFVENIPRVLPGKLDAVIHRQAWTVPPLFRLIQERGGVPADEMYRVFNMGIGMVAIVEKRKAAGLQKAILEQSWVIGELVEGSHTVILD
jgi:phosphoribosylamine--glycine ligase/phosphoribosylaminoimidazole synthetase